MDHVRLGMTDLQVSPIAFGTWQLGGDWGAFDEQEATAAIRHALALGVNLFDTAQAYGFGVSEGVLGRALAPELRARRDEVVIATKGGQRPNGDHDIGVLVYGPLAHGLLTGAIGEETTFEATYWRAASPLFQGDTLRRNLEAVRRLQQLAGELGVTVSALAIAWTLAQPAVDVAIVGARRSAHIEDSVGAAELRLGASELAEIDAIMDDAVTVGGPSPESV